MLDSSFNVVLITGISGSGKSVALRQLEDQNYLCVDNLPVRYLQDLIMSARQDNLEKIAVAIDVRTHGELETLPGVIQVLRSLGIPIRVIFLDSDDSTLVKRYSESRRSHPLTLKLQRVMGKSPTLQDCINHERELLAPLRDEEYVIDTSGLAPSQLRQWISDLVPAQTREVLLTFQSFAFKNGVPNDADLVFDVRCLPNPHYDARLKPLTGKDKPVADWLERFDSVKEMIDDISHFIEKWLPQYLRDTRSYLTIGIGCTGGQHRSVYVAEQLGKRFSQHSALRVRHRAQKC